jgi:hypothetical protein
VTITQYPSKYIEFGAGGNVFVNGYYARLTPDSGYTVSDLPKGSMDNRQENYRGYSFDYACTFNSDYSCYYSDSSNYNKVYTKKDNNVYGQWNARLAECYPNDKAYNLYGISTSYEYVRGSLESSAALAFEHSIDVYVTAFSPTDHTFSFNNNASTLDYVIGNSLVNGTFTPDTEHNTSSYYRNKNVLYDYYIGGFQQSNTYYRYIKSWGELASKIKVGATSTNYDNVIAPLFKIQSSYGAAAYGVFFDVAQKRCATYQEAGYPAGRWRLPTLAEIAFIVKLQNDGVLEKVFNTSATGYWTSSGGKLVANSEMTYTKNFKDEDTNDPKSSIYSYVRCVYDLWYWGSDPVKPTHEFHPMPTKQ